MAIKAPRTAWASRQATLVANKAGVSLKDLDEGEAATIQGLADDLTTERLLAEADNLRAIEDEDPEPDADPEGGPPTPR